MTSVVSKECSNMNVRMPELKKPPKLRKYVGMKKKGDTDMLIRKTIVKDFTNNKKEYDLDEKTEDEIAEDGEVWRKPKSYELDAWMEENKKSIRI